MGVLRLCCCWKRDPNVSIFGIVNGGYETGGVAGYTDGVITGVRLAVR